MSARAGRPSAGDAPQTLILTRSDVGALMDQAAWRDAAALAFRALSEGRALAPEPMAIAGDGGAFHAKGARLRLDRCFVALKLNGNFPANMGRHGLPTIQGAILLCDGESGRLLAIVDSIEITLRRTAAATALAAQSLARSDSRTILICGCGAQSRAQLEALRQMLPLERCFAWDRDPGRASAFAAAARESGLDAFVSSDLAGAALASDVIVTCTTSRQPFLEVDMVSAGTFVAAVGADSPEKSEIGPALMAKAKVVADVLDQCIAMGDLHHAVAAGAMTHDAVHAELAGLVSGARPGRTSADEIFIFDSTGTGLQDVAAAAMVYARAAAGGRGLGIALAA